MLPISPIGSGATQHIEALSAKLPPTKKELSSAFEVSDRIVRSVKPPPTRKELSTTSEVFGRMAAHLHMEASKKEPVSNMMGWIHGISLAFGLASIAYVIYVFSKKNSSTSEKVMAALGLLTIPLNIWDVVSLNRLRKEHKQQKTAKEQKTAATTNLPHIIA